MKNKGEWKNKANLVSIILLILAYFAGMLLMILGHFGAGVTLWAFSTVFGALILYVKRINEKKAADEKEFEEAERLYQENLKKEQEKL